MSLQKIIAPDLHEGVDRKLLKTLKERFLQVNAGRLDRMLTTLGSQHRLFLESLPLLLHVNHPSLPGYVSGATPCGLSGFVPDKNHIRAAQTISRSFAYRKKAVVRDRIYSIFLMGSTGTVAHSEASDMDIWVCYDPSVKQSELTELLNKLSGIERWADRNGLEVHFFLMDPAAFRKGQRSDLSGEDCGSTQHYLLLDEFYRTSILLSGRAPLWWMIPASEEKNYDELADLLTSKRFVGADEYIDFGGISDFPPGEFVGAGLWQLYKGIDAPYKSIIKILLTEVYASEHPKVASLSLIYKQAVYEDKLELDELDPYVMLYRKIERYLNERDEPQRLALIRKSFYFKVQEYLSHNSRPNYNWRRQLMQRLTKEWHWEERYLVELDNRRRWSIDKVSEEQQLLVREFNDSYRFLSNFVREHSAEASINQTDLSVLGRKLHAAFERKRGKIERLNSGIASAPSELNLSFHFVADQEYGINDHWVVYSGYVKRKDAERHESLRKDKNIVQLLTWCYFNHVLDGYSRLSVEPGSTDMTENELTQLAQSLMAIFPEDEPGPPQSQFEAEPVPMQVAFFINAGIDPMGAMTQKGIHRISDQSDALSYSAFHQNLVVSIDQITMNSWGEIVCQQYNGENALLDCLVSFTRLIPPDSGINLPKLSVRCHCLTRASSIANRVSELFSDIINCYYKGLNPGNLRYILEVENLLYLIQFKRSVPVIRGMRNQEELLLVLREPQQNFSPIVVDRYALSKHPLKVVVQTNEEHKVQVFYQRQGDLAVVVIADELGSMFCTQKIFFSEKTVLNPIRHFLENIQQRRASQGVVASVAYYEIQRSANGELQAQRKQFTPPEKMNQYHNVKVIARPGSFDDIVYTIYCDGREFSHLEYGEALFESVAAHIASLRKQQTLYPFYITDLDLSQISHDGHSQVQTIQYLEHKEKIETAINQALNTN